MKVKKIVHNELLSYQQVFFAQYTR